MQVDTGSDVTLISKNFWEQMGKPKLKSSSVPLKQFDGSMIKAVGHFNGMLDTPEQFETISVTVVDCIKSHGCSKS